MIEELLKESRELFIWDKISADKRKELDEKAEELLNNNNYVDVFEAWNYILRHDCDTEDKVITFVDLMFSFVGFSVAVPHPYDPYDFIGYIYSKVDLEKNWDKCGDTFDSFVNDILMNSNNLDLMKDPYYQFWRDPKILEIAERYGKK